MEQNDRMKSADYRPLRGGTLLALGLWMRSAIAGAAFAAAGVASLFDPGHGVSLSMALTWIAAGGTFAWFARHRAVTLLDGPDVDRPAGRERDDASRMRSAARAPASS
jgi:hypothetical protein